MAQVVQNDCLMSRFDKKLRYSTTYVPGTAGNQDLHKKDCPFRNCLGYFESITRVGCCEADRKLRPSFPHAGTPRTNVCAESQYGRPMGSRHPTQSTVGDMLLKSKEVWIFLPVALDGEWRS